MKAETAVNKKKSAFRVNSKTKTIRTLIDLFLKLLRFNGSKFVWNEFVQRLNCYTFYNFNSSKIWFKTGHGRLLWRAKSFSYEEKLMVKWLDTFRDDDIFFDIGANVGIYSLAAATKCRHVYAFEPVYQNLAILEENVVRNNLESKITIVPLPLSDSNSLIKIRHRSLGKSECNQLFGVENHGLDIDSRFDASSDEIPYVLNHLTASLDELVQVYNMPMPTKLKLDVDGCEQYVLKGSTNVLKASTLKSAYFEDNTNEGEGIFDKFFKKEGFVITDKVKLNHEVFKGSNVLVQRS